MAPPKLAAVNAADMVRLLVVKRKFLELRGLSVWWGGVEMPSAEQGAEQLADVIAWGLMGFEVRNVPQIQNNSVSELTEAFDMLTRGSSGR